MQRCGWVSQDPLYIEYHDTEWGVAQKEGRQLFEMICLEGQQRRGIFSVPLADHPDLQGDRSSR